MALPVIGIFGVIVGWVVKKVGFKVVVTALQFTMTGAALVASFSVFGIAITIIIMVYNKYKEFSTAFDTVTSADNIAVKMASASGLLPAFFDVLSLFLPLIILFLTYKLALFFRELAWKLSKAVFQVGMQVQV